MKTIVVSNAVYAAIWQLWSEGLKNENEILADLFDVDPGSEIYVDNKPLNGHVVQAKPKKPGSRNRYPWGDTKVGGSFIVPASNRRASRKHLRSKLGTAIWNRRTKFNEEYEILEEREGYRISRTR